MTQSLLMTAIDTAFDSVLRITVGFVTWFRNTYAPAPRHIYQEPTAVIDDHEVAQIEKSPVTFKTVRDILQTETKSLAVAQKNTVMYAQTVAVPIYANPTVEFDTQIGSIPYGELVLMVKPQGRFYQVIWNGIEGWVLRDDLADRANRVYPEFLVGQENLVDHVNTSHVRAIIGDTFGIGRSDFPLQAGEYIVYRLWRKGIHIPWTDVRPRVPGLWHTILRGSPKVHSSITPTVGSIMEYVFDQEIGHVGYVEAVFPDQTITISEVNYPDSGIYNERELSQEEWKALKPVFINIKP